MNPYIESLGYLAATLSIAWSLPQTIKAIKTKSIVDIAPETVMLVAIALGIWAYYGVRIGSNSVILTNVIAFALYFPLLFMRLSHDEETTKKVIYFPIMVTICTAVSLTSPTFAVGLFAAGVNFASTAFQMTRTQKTQSVQDISFLSMGIRMTSFVLWTIYGFLTHASPLIIANILGLFVIGGLVLQHIIYTQKSRSQVLSSKAS